MEMSLLERIEGWAKSWIPFQFYESDYEMEDNLDENRMGTDVNLNFLQIRTFNIVKTS
jgi:hypothetical protein